MQESIKLVLNELRLFLFARSRQLRFSLFFYFRSIFLLVAHISFHFIFALCRLLYLCNMRQYYEWDRRRTSRDYQKSKHEWKTSSDRIEWVKTMDEKSYTDIRISLRSLKVSRSRREKKYFFFVCCTAEVRVSVRECCVCNQKVSQNICEAKWMVQSEWCATIGRETESHTKRPFAASTSGYEPCPWWKSQKNSISSFSTCQQVRSTNTNEICKQLIRTAANCNTCNTMSYESPSDTPSTITQIVQHRANL